MLKATLAAAFVGAVLAGYFLFFDSGKAAAVPAAEARRGTIVSTLTTNGRIEAGGGHDAAAGTSGAVRRILAAEGQHVERGAALVEIDNAAARLEAEQAEARLAAAHAELASLKRGVPPSERTGLERRGRSLEASLEALRAELAQTERLVERGAAARAEAADLRLRIDETEAAIAENQAKLGGGAAREELDRAKAAIREAEAGAALANQRVEAATVRAPTSGRIYSLAVRPGAYVEAGSVIARIAGGSGPTALIFVDEPELGRIASAEYATLSTDAFPGLTWRCRIDRGPTEIVEIGARRVGDLRCTVEGDAPGLIPNLTVNVEIQTEKSENAVIVPREVLRRAGDEEFVWTVGADGRAQKRPAVTGIRGLAEVEIRSGIDAGDLVLLPSGVTLAEGLRVEPLR